MAFWPYEAQCGAGLAGYLGAVFMVALSGVWIAVVSWRRRAAWAHIISLLLIMWGGALAAIEILPRVGYARASLDHPAIWRCALRGALRRDAMRTRRPAAIPLVLAAVRVQACGGASRVAPVPGGSARSASRRSNALPPGDYRGILSGILAPPPGEMPRDVPLEVGLTAAVHIVGDTTRIGFAADETVAGTPRNLYARPLFPRATPRAPASATWSAGGTSSAGCCSAPGRARWKGDARRPIHGPIAERREHAPRCPTVGHALATDRRRSRRAPPSRSAPAGGGVVISPCSGNSTAAAADRARLASTVPAPRSCVPPEPTP